MYPPITPITKRSLADDLALRIKEMIDRGDFAAGARLPAINEMARLFGVGHPSIREGLKKLETLGVVKIRHGSGVYVSEQQDPLFVSNPISTAQVDRKMLLDIIETRIPLEVLSIGLAARRISDEQIAALRALLAEAEAHLQDDRKLNLTNMAIHREIARASGNQVLPQVLRVMSNLFGEQQQIILRIYGSRAEDHRQHVAIVDALEKRDPEAAEQLMRRHLHGVRTAIELWNPEETPLNVS